MQSFNCVFKKFKIRTYLRYISFLSRSRDQLKKKLTTVSLSIDPSFPANSAQWYPASRVFFDLPSRKIEGDCARRVSQW